MANQQPSWFTPSGTKDNASVGGAGQPSSSVPYKPLEGTQEENKKGKQSTAPGFQDNKPGYAPM